MSFLAYCLHFTLVSDCKITNKIPIHKKNFATARRNPAVAKRIAKEIYYLM